MKTAKLFYLENFPIYGIVTVNVIFPDFGKPTLWAHLVFQEILI